MWLLKGILVHEIGGGGMQEKINTIEKQKPKNINATISQAKKKTSIATIDFFSPWVVTGLS